MKQKAISMTGKEDSQQEWLYFLQASHIPIDKMKLCTLAVPSLLLSRGAGLQFSQFSAYIVLGCWQKLEIHLELGISV